MRLSQFVAKLSEEGKLTEIERPVSTKYETAAILKKLDGSPVYFSNVKDYEMPIVGNLFSTPDLLASSIGIRKEDWIKTMLGAIDSPGQLVEGANIFEYMEPDLGILPILTHYPKDRAPYITSGVVLAKLGDWRNASVHRLAKLENDKLDDKLVGRLVEGRDLHAMYTAAKEQKKDLPVAVAIGNSAGVVIGGSTSVERGFYELTIAAALEGGQLEVVKGKSIDVQYPAGSEVVLEGRILYDETAKEGPFVDLTETYDGVREQPVFAIDTIAIQKNPIYQALLPGGNEHKLLMGQPRTPTIYRALLKEGIDVADVYLTEGGSGWLDAVVSIRKKSEEDGRKAIEATIKGHRSLKKITIVDEDVDITNPHDVNYALTMYWESGKETILKGVKGSSLDPMGTPDGFGSKIGFDATKPLGASEEKKGKVEKARMGFEVDLKDYL